MRWVLERTFSYTFSATPLLASHQPPTEIVKEPLFESAVIGDICGQIQLHGFG
jgi:hypothetical protein